MDRLPPNPANSRLTLDQLEYLTDNIVCRYSDDPDIGESLILLMDEVERVALHTPLDIENVTVPIKHHAFYRIHDSENRQQALITELRGRLAQHH